jgi:hypothetical protein
MIEKHIETEITLKLRHLMELLAPDCNSIRLFKLDMQINSEFIITLTLTSVMGYDCVIVKWYVYIHMVRKEKFFSVDYDDFNIKSKILNILNG